MCSVSFLCVMIQASIDYTFGLIILPLVNEFGCTQSQVSWIGSINNGVLYISGLFASVAVEAYGLRPVLMSGGAIGAFAFGISALAWNIPFMVATFGIMGGTGLGFIYTPSLISCSYHFERWRALATGIALCGK